MFFLLKDDKSVLTANVIPFHRPVDMQRNGLQATLIPDQRWLHCDIKSLSLLGNLLSLEEARSNGYDEALLHREGFLRKLPLQIYGLFPKERCIRIRMAIWFYLGSQK